MRINKEYNFGVNFNIMAADPIINREADLIEVVNESEMDDLVQVLGVDPSDNSDEIMVQSVEIDDGESVFIDVDEEFGSDSESDGLLDTDNGHSEDMSDNVTIEG